MSNIVGELNLSELSPLQRQLNVWAMIGFINANPKRRANLNIERSIVLYDEHRSFCYATPEFPRDEQLRHLSDPIGARFWSKGC